jgi:uncharacterized protein (DUF2062 family)
MRAGIAFALFLFITAIVLALTQIWFPLFKPVTFFKLELTLGALLIIVVVMLYVVNEYREYRAIHSGENRDASGPQN